MVVLQVSEVSEVLEVLGGIGGIVMVVVKATWREGPVQVTRESVHPS
jgi:hypothetical protein